MSSFPESFSAYNTEYAGVALLWDWLKRCQLLRVLNHIPLNLKTVRRTPRSKLEDLLACLMTGVESLGQIDVRMRYDRGLTLALGRSSLADQSLMSQTLDAFEERSLKQLRQNIVNLLSQHSRALRRIRWGRFTVLDLDMTDLPCSRRCEGALKGRTTGKRGRTVRQLSVVYNHHYREPLDLFLHAGNVHSAAPLEEIVQTLEQAHGWQRNTRRTICWRLDSGYGSDGKLSWLMRRGYRVVAKGLSDKRAAAWARSIPDSTWRRVHSTQDVYERGRTPKLTSPHRCLLIRTHRTKLPGYRYSYLASNLEKWVRPKGHVLFYNQRQGIEKELQQIKTVLGLKHKRKRSFNGMQALALLTLIANLEMIWFRRELRLNHLGLKRFIRDVLKTPGFVARKRSGLSARLTPENAYFQQLQGWQSNPPLPLFPSQSRSILYKN